MLLNTLVMCLNEAYAQVYHLVYIFVIVPCPEIIEPPKNNSVLLEQTAKFYCLAFSFGSLTYDWRKLNGNSVDHSTVKSYVHKKVIRGATAVRSLEIPNIELSDKGEYCCVATNECGSVTKCAWLNVIGK